MNEQQEQNGNGAVWTSSFAKWVMGILGTVLMGGLTLLMAFFWFDRNALDRQMTALGAKVDQEIQNRNVSVVALHSRADSIRQDVSSNASNINGLQTGMAGLKDLLNGQVVQLASQISSLKDQNTANYSDLKADILEIRRTLQDRRTSGN